MNFFDRLALFSNSDLFALCLILLIWLAIGWRIENPSFRKPSTSVLMGEYRREWMRQMVTRQPRIMDSHLLSTLRQGTSFFASGAMLAIGGVLALIGNPDPLRGVASDLSLDHTPAIVWEIKLLLILFFLANAFLKFVWSHRLFGYCAVLIAAVPNDTSDDAALPRAAKAAELNITAARGFNRGLRSIYFALASTAWLINGWALIVATLVTVMVLWRREFLSHSREVLISASDGMKR